MDDLVRLIWSTAFLASALRLSVPILYAGLGEIVSERAGNLNVGLEGMMLAGAFGSVLVAWWTNDPWLGLVGGAAAGILVTVIQGIVAITLGGDQVVSGVALNLGVSGLTVYLSRSLWGIGETRPTVAHFTRIGWEPLARVPVLGPILTAQTPLLYLAVLAALVVALVLWRTRWGLIWRAAGEDPAGLDAVGRSVAFARWSALLVTGAFAGVGGSAISLGQLFTFIEQMSGGRGFIALALVIVARWRPGVAFAAALLFGAADAIALRIQALGITIIPYQVGLMIPYLLTLAAYALTSRAGSVPRALGRPFIKR